MKIGDINFESFNGSTEFYAYPTDYTCYYYVVCDVRRDVNYYYCAKSNTWLKNDFLNCSHYPDLDSIPNFSVKTSVIKIYLMMECVCDKKRKSSHKSCSSKK